MFYFSPWGIILQAIAFIHFVRRRPETYWLWIIIIGGGLGALAYIVVEVIPDVGLLRQSLQVFPRRKRIRQMEAIILDNPSPGNYEELAGLYLDENRFADARNAYNKAIATSRSEMQDAHYRRAIAILGMNDAAGAIPDLELVMSRDPKYDSHRAMGLLAHAYAVTGRGEEAEVLFERATGASTLSETYYNFASLLASNGRNAEARQWAERILAKKATLPGYLRRRERPWLRRAAALLKRTPVA